MRVKIVTGYDGICSYREMAMANFSEYCERWGYELVAKFDGWGPVEEIQGGGQIGWTAIFRRRWQLIAQELDDCDWLLWLDPDCIIMNMTIPITKFIDDTIDVAITGPFHPCDKCGAPVYSSGVILIRSCDWSKNMLRDCLAEMHTDWRQGPTAHCTELAGNNWFCCKFLPANMNMTHVKVIAPKTAGYYTVVTPGQFLVHLYGSSDEGRVSAMRTCLTTVVR